MFLMCFFFKGDKELVFLIMVVGCIFVNKFKDLCNFNNFCFGWLLGFVYLGLLIVFSKIVFVFLYVFKVFLVKGLLNVLIEVLLNLWCFIW